MSNKKNKVKGARNTTPSNPVEDRLIQVTMYQSGDTLQIEGATDLGNERRIDARNLTRDIRNAVRNSTLLVR